jgi:hypothetical protein
MRWEATQPPSQTPALLIRCAVSASLIALVDLAFSAVGRTQHVGGFMPDVAPTRGALLRLEPVAVGAGYL